MAADRLDVADIRALLSSGNRIVQSQGLGGLFVRLKPPFRNPAERVAVLSCLFDCFTQFGDAVSQWTAEGVPHLVNSVSEGRFSKCRSVVDAVCDRLIRHDLRVCDELSVTILHKDKVYLTREGSQA
ncbi:unnamed protein product [Heligmosomoides polygyrus]|uniref:DUF2378 family protein n=1 Tax=Heligmosomoides polygyrus TaxID=6339 RepID=A0A3P7XMV8_HELPZ|nr:unnamed protein product [Heligmosomoides polygyrus]